MYIAEVEMITNIDPTVDLVFKKIFGNADHPELTKSLVNALLAQLGKEPVAELELRNPYRLADVLGDKEAELDILAKEPNGRSFQIEIQVKALPNLPHRMLDNWAGVYMRQLKKGEDYHEHKDCYSF